MPVLTTEVPLTNTDWALIGTAELTGGVVVQNATSVPFKIQLVAKGSPAPLSSDNVGMIVEGTGTFTFGTFHRNNNDADIWGRMTRGAGQATFINRTGVFV